MVSKIEYRSFRGHVCFYAIWNFWSDLRRLSLAINYRKCLGL